MENIENKNQQITNIRGFSQRSRRNLLLLYVDEFKGFYKSKLMTFLWIGLPLLSFLLQYLNPDASQTDGIPLTSLIALLLSSIGGSLSAVMISTSLSNEINKKVYDLFLVRPVKRYELLLSKYLAVLTCLFIAVGISILIGAIVDYSNYSELPPEALENIFRINLESLVVSFSAIIIACSFGLVFGVSVKSVAASAILSLYIGNQLSSIILLPTIFYSDLKIIPYSLTMAILLGGGIFLIGFLIFSKKEL
ncbi:MAG: ABC transporter permease [Promethearchaeota archaeon]